MLFPTTNLTKARLMDYYQVMNLVDGYLQQEDLDKLNLKTVSDEFKTAFGLLDSSLKQAQKTGFTDAIIAGDDARDNILTGFMGSLRNLVRFPDKDISVAATQLLVVADKYGQGVTRLPQREETAVITNMIADLRSTTNVALLHTCGLMMWVDKLDEANRAFDELYSHRSEKEAEFVTGLTRTQRDKMQAAFNKLTLAIEAYAFINGEDAYKPLANKINVEIANVQVAAKARSTQAATLAKTKSEAVK